LSNNESQRDNQAQIESTNDSNSNQQSDSNRLSGISSDLQDLKDKADLSNTNLGSIKDDLNDLLNGTSETDSAISDKLSYLDSPYNFALKSVS